MESSVATVRITGIRQPDIAIYHHLTWRIYCFRIPPFSFYYIFSAGLITRTYHKAVWIIRFCVFIIIHSKAVRIFVILLCITDPCRHEHIILHDPVPRRTRVPHGLDESEAFGGTSRIAPQMVYRTVTPVCIHCRLPWSVPL